MELGRGAAFPLGTWVAAASAVGLDLGALRPSEEPFGVAAIVGLARAAGWSTPDEVGASATETERGSGWCIALRRRPRPRRLPGRASMTSGEAAVVMVTDVVTDARDLIEAFDGAVAAMRATAPVGWRTSGLLVVRRTPANRRRLSDGRGLVDAVFPDSGSRWVASFDGPGAIMPDRPGLLWLDHLATRLIPTRLRLRGA